MSKTLRPTKISFSKAHLIAFVLVFSAIGGYIFLSSKAAGPTTHVCTGRSFFIDYVGGVDTNAGTSSGAAWKRAPGMVGFAGTYTHQVHDCFYFKGGVTWPNAVFPLRPTAGGNASDNDYYGPDYSWFTGASWARPIFDAQGSPITNGGNNCGFPLTKCNTFFDLPQADYVTIDNFELTGWKLNSATGYGTCAMINWGGVTHELADHMYVHNFVDTVEASDTDCMVFEASTSSPGGGSSVIQNSVLAGDPNSYMEASRSVNYMYNNVIHDFPGMVFPSGDADIHGNLLYNCDYPNTQANSTGSHHDDLLQVNPYSGIGNFTVYIHDNVMHGTGGHTSPSDECELGLVGNPGETDYIWNNVAWDIQGNSFGYPQAGTNGVGFYAWDNSIDASSSANNTPCFRGSGTMTNLFVQNNFCINNFQGITVGTATNQAIDHNIQWSPAQANSAGYTKNESPYAYYPPTSTSATVDTGVSLSSKCTGILASLCQDSTYAVGVDAGNQVVLNQRSPVSRPQGSAWDIGVYEYQAPAGTTANLWVDTNGGTCTRSATLVVYSDTAACGSFQAAWSAAQSGDTIRVKAGTYGGQTITGNKTSQTFIVAENGTTLTAAVVAQGNFLTLQNFTIDAGSARGQSSGAEIDASNVTFKSVNLYGPFVSMYITGPNFTWQGGKLGQDGTVGGLRGACNGDGEPIWIESSATGAILDGIKINPQDGDPTPVGCSANGAHIEDIRIQETQNVTIKNSYFVDDSQAPGNGDGSGHIFITSTSPSTTAANGLKLYNNIFEPVDGSYSIQQHTNVQSCANYVFAYNTFYQDNLISCNNTSTFNWVGNLGTKPASGCDGTYVKNVWQNNTNTVCGTDKWVLGPQFGIGNLGIGTSGHISAGSPAIDAAETPGASDFCSHGLGAIDIDGNTRPQGTACDAGADEYVPGSSSSIPGDLNSDGHVNITDLSIMLSHYGQTGTATQGDCNNDGNINILDLSILLSHYGM